MSRLQEIRTVGTHSVSVSRDVWDVVDRIQRGDATVGWSGDPRMYVVFNQQRGAYQIFRHAEDGRDYLVMNCPPNEFDVRIVRKLALGDTQTRDVLGMLEEEERLREWKEESDNLAMEEEMRDVMRHYAKKSGLI